MVLALVTVLAASIVWLGLRGLQAKDELEAAQGRIGELSAQAADLDIAGARDSLTAIEGHTTKAVELTSDPVWRAAEVVPFAGGNLTAVRELASATELIINEVASPLLDLAATIDPATLAPQDGAINLQPFIDAEPVVIRSNAGLKKAIKKIDAIDVQGTIPQVTAAKAKISSMLPKVAPILDTMESVVPLLAPALGSAAPRTYLVMFQNNAESRPLGGTALSFTTIIVDQGRITLGDAVPAGFANFSKHSESFVPVPDGVQELYEGNFGTFIANATVRPSFTSAAEMVQAMWASDRGYPVDGVVSIDPVALSYILRATDPVTLSTGDVLTSDSIVPLLLNDVYQRFNTGNNARDNARQDVVYSEAVDATFAALMSGNLKPVELVSALIQGWTEQRLLYWSANESEQAVLASLGLNGELPISDDETERVGLYFSDNVGSKLNFYLQQSVVLSQGSCLGDGRQNYRVSAQLTSTLPAADVRKLSPSITGLWQRENLPPGLQRLQVFLYAPPGATITGATVNGTPVELAAFHDTSYPVGKLTVGVEPGATVSIVYDLISAATSNKTLEASITPMVHPTKVSSDVLDCSTVAAG